LTVLAQALAGSALANDAHLTISKIADDVGAATAGATIGFTITVQVHTDETTNDLCRSVSPDVVQCPAHNVVVTDALPAAPTGLNWVIDTRNSNAGCGVQRGLLTCLWGDLTAPNELKSVPVVTSTAASMCGTVVNADAHVEY
jgi:hypothetical protein